MTPSEATQWLRTRTDAITIAIWRTTTPTILAHLLRRLQPAIATLSEPNAPRAQNSRRR